jgi:hypothetical protein
VEQLLINVVADGFVLYCCGPKAAPNALVASYEWEHYVDLLTIRDFDRITTARVPTRGGVDIFAPELVVWAYQGPPQHALRALLDLMHPAHPDAPTVDYPAPASLRVPRAQQRPMTIRPPSPGRARARAARLATAMTIHSGDHATDTAAPTGAGDPGPPDETTLLIASVYSAIEPARERAAHHAPSTTTAFDLCPDINGASIPQQCQTPRGC